MFVLPYPMDLVGMVAVSENMRTLTKDTILYMLTLPLMSVLVILSFKDLIPNLIKYCSRELVWLFP